MNSNKFKSISKPIYSNNLKFPSLNMQRKAKIKDRLSNLSVH